MRLTFVLLSAFALTLLTPPVGHAAKGEKPIKIRQIILKRGKTPEIPRSNEAIYKPTVIDSAEKLAKIFTNPAAQKEISAHVNFKTESVIYFAWSGSGEDSILAKVVVDDEKKKKLMFYYTPGLTEDFRQQFRLYTMPKGMPYEVSKFDSNSS